MDQKERKVPSRLARQRAAREKRENRRAPWLTALLVIIIALLAVVPLLNTSADLYQKPNKKSERLRSRRPKDKAKTASQAAKKTSKAKTEKTVTYYVQSGDYWASIAEKYGLTADELAKQNGMDTSQTLSVGQKLVIKTSK